MRIPLLDHGYVELKTAWGSDEEIIESARMSTGRGFLGWGPLAEDCDKCQGDGDASNGETCKNCGGTGKKPGDEKLLKYLIDHKHTTPFEVPGATFEVMCPVVVVWQWVRHRTMTYNILSGRYAAMPEEDYLPTVERCLVDGGKNKQAGKAAGSAALTPEATDAWLTEVREVYAHIDRVYRSGLAIGIPKEVARLPLTFGKYTRMRVSTDLHNWLRFLSLRCPSDSQYEIRVYADAIRTILAEKFPRTLALFAPPA